MIALMLRWVWLTGWAQSAAFALAVICLSLFYEVAAAQTRHATAVSGRKAKVLSVVSLNFDCSVREIPEVYLQVPPKVGEVFMEAGEDFFFAAKGSPHSKCNGQKVLAMIIYYQSVPGALGTDNFTLRAIWAEEGESRSIPVTVKLR
jgi:hypothetical protein